MSLKQKWWIYGILGALCLGGGLTLAIEASHWKHNALSWIYWTCLGTIGLSLHLIGVYLLIRAGITKYQLDKL